jgi:hypothetical protein
MFSASFLFASLLWGSVGFGYFIYGRKQGAWSPTFAGVAMMALSYSWLPPWSCPCSASELFSRFITFTNRAFSTAHSLQEWR